MLMAYDIKQILTLWGTLTIALLLFTLIVAGTNVYRTTKQFWLRIILSWAVAYLLGGVLFLFFKADLIFTLMIASLVAYILMGDVLFGRKKLRDEDFEKSERTNE